MLINLILKVKFKFKFNIMNKSKLIKQIISLGNFLGQEVWAWVPNYDKKKVWAQLQNEEIIAVEFLNGEEFFLSCDESISKYTKYCWSLRRGYSLVSHQSQLMVENVSFEEAIKVMYSFMASIFIDYFFECQKE